MYVTLSLASLVSLLEATIAVMLAAMLVASGRQGATWLAAFVALLASIFVLPVVQDFNPPESVSVYVRWLRWIQYLAMPVLFQYTQLAVGKPEKLPFPHYLLPLLMAVLMLPMMNAILPSSSVFLVGRWALTFQGVAYLVAIIYLVRRYRVGLKQNFSSLTGISLIWLEQLALWLLVIVVFDAVLFPLLSGAGVSFGTIQFIFNLCCILYVLWLARSALQQHFLPVVPPEKPNKSYEKSGLDEHTAGALADTIVSAMKDNQLYLSSELVLADLANAAGVTNHILSEVLNKTIGQNFYDFVNCHRIDTAKKMLLDTDRPVLEIAFEAGFNNKASFNQAFKKHVNMTPSQYRHDTGS